MHAPLFIDLFAGAGGLSLGLTRAGFQALLAVETSPMAAESYFRNMLDRDITAWSAHLKRSLDEQILAGLAVSPTAAVLERADVVRELLDGRDLDLLAGGPPCQGFSIAGLRDPLDRRNQLPFEFLSFVRLLRPRLVLLENVPGIGARFSRASRDTVLGQLSKGLRDIGPGYRTLAIRVNAQDFGLAQRRPRIILIAWQADWEAALPTKWALSAARNGEQPVVSWADLEAGRGRPGVTVFSVLGDLASTGYAFEQPDEYPAMLGPAMELRFSASTAPPVARSLPAPSKPPNHVLRAHGERVSRRFALLHAFHERGVSPDILTIPRDAEEEDIVPLIDSWIAATPLDLPIQFGDLALATSNEELRSLMFEVATRKHSQRVLARDGTSRTVLSLPDDLIHFSEARTLTVREMARLQGFPDRFVFFGQETTGGLRRRHQVPQYTQVANAVPPPLAEAVGSALVAVTEAMNARQPVLVGVNEVRCQPRPIREEHP